MAHGALKPAFFLLCLPLLLTLAFFLGGGRFFRSIGSRLLLCFLRSFFGGRLTSYETLLDRGRREAVLRMKQAAHERGAHMVVNVLFETSALNQNQPGRAESAYPRSAWGLALSVRVRDPVRFRRRVALGGPLPVAGLGLVMATGAAIASSSVLAGASAALLVHGLGTLPGSSDGNRIWNL